MSTVPARQEDPAQALMAVMMMLVACALLAGTTLIAKTLGPVGSGEAALHPLQVTAGRFTFAAIALMPFMVWLRPPLRGAAWGNHAMRVGFGWAGVTCLFAAASMMRLADATAISFLNPIVAMILSIPLLGEKVGPWRWGAAGIAFAGAVILTEPGSGAIQIAALIALLAAIFMGAEAILIKKLSDSEPPLRILTINNLAGMMLALTAASFVWRWPSPDQWLLLALLGVTMVSVQALFIQALRRGDASFVMPFFYTTLIFAAFYDFVTFGEIPTLAAWMGAGLIITGALVVAWRERMVRRRRSLDAKRPDTGPGLS
ncbi:EamA family transporter [Chelativorans sp. ZYF759]|uniref:DMT family transporter n=1 Tax=Chelativorans sp. ZYF759 TaxID=2692213 RepID=UPI00145D0C68|nr:DMT family transporter [Chelativorans sp. ZYF759]NMG41036.1 EamA family transporter [Chelativorans sp. ZYF759]